MIYYHCSPEAGLTVLNPRVSHLFDERRVVYMTSSLPMALMYSIRHFEYSYGYRWKDGKPGAIYFEEYFPDALVELYAGKSAWLYRCEAGDYKTTKKPNEYISFSPVRVTGATLIPDALEALLAQERAGRLEIVRYHQMSEAGRAWIRREETETILKHGLLHQESDFARFMKEKYPLSWQDAIKRKGRDG